MSNPTIDEAFDFAFAKMDQGAGAHYVLPEAHAELKARYYRSFNNKLKEEDAWRNEGGQVLNAAFQIGAVAAALAHLQQKNEIDEDLALMAGKVIEQRCGQVFGPRGRWCEPDPPPASRELEALLGDHDMALRSGDPEALRTVYQAAKPFLEGLTEQLSDRGARKGLRFLLKIADQHCNVEPSV